VIAEKIAAYLSESKGLSKDGVLKLDTPLVQSGIVDSLGMVDLVQFLEETFTIRINDEDMVPDNFDTVAAMAAFVERKIAE
jgi:acyl carrier protein